MSLVFVLVAVVVLASPGGGPSVAAQVQERHVKAAFLYNFTKYVDWPPSAFPRPEEPFHFCVLADADFVEAARELIGGETARGRPLQLVEPDSRQLSACHILFIGSSHAQQSAAALRAVARLPVLTVGETPGFLEEGGAIVLVVDDNRVRFDIDVAAAERAGLGISSKLVRVARHVKERTAR